MLIERATLLKIAKDTAAQRMAARPSLISAYLTGSVAANEPLLGDATDIDLILIDAEPPTAVREIIRLTDHVILDIQIRSKSDYATPKALRVHPWLGPELCEPYFLHDPRHFFELAQSSARGQFHRPDFVATRARAFMERARENLHLGLLPGQPPSAPVTIPNLCLALFNAANALITLTGLPAGGRRIVTRLENAARQLGRADGYDEFVAVFGADFPNPALAQRLLADWSAAYQAGQSPTDELIHPARRLIYERGWQTYIQHDRAYASVWLMLYTWQACMKNLPGDSPLADQWLAFLELLQMAEPENFVAKVHQASAYLELTDQIVESWAEQNGA